MALLTMPSATQTNFLRKLSVQLLSASHLAVIIVSQCMGSIDLPWGQRSKVVIVIVVHFNNSD